MIGDGVGGALSFRPHPLKAGRVQDAKAAIVAIVVLVDRLAKFDSKQI